MSSAIIAFCIPIMTYSILVLLCRPGEITKLNSFINVNLMPSLLSVSRRSFVSRFDRSILVSVYSSIY